MRELISRGAVASVVCLALLALTLPMRAVTPPEKAPMSCCAHLPAQDADDNHCGDQPDNAQDQHCCGMCAIGFSLLLAPGTHLIFSPSGGESLLAFSAAQSARSDRPPVPPPRSTLA